MTSCLFFNILLFYSICMFKRSLQSTQASVGERRLVDALFQDYDPRVRPVSDPAMPVNVGILFIPTRLESLNERQQILTTFGIIYLLWEDEFLKWNPADYAGAKRIVVHPKTIWMPEIAVENSVQDLQDLSMDTNFRVEVKYTGMVSWSPGFRWETSCNVDMTLFPFDVQTCTVSLVNWVYGEDGIRLFKIEPGIYFGSYMENGEWEVVKSVMVADHLLYETSSNISLKLPRAYFTLRLRRNPTFYNLFMLFPCIIVFSLSMLTFLLPAESTEKITLGITVFLSYSFLIVIVADSTPQTGAQPRLAKFIITAMLLTALALVQAIWTLRLFFHTPLQPVPPWIQKFFLHIIGPRLGFSNFIRRNRIRGMSELQKLSVHTIGALGQLGGRRQTLHGVQEIPLVYTDSDEETDELKKKISLLELEEILKNVKKITDILSKQQFELDEDTNRRNWQMVSRVFDRICMIFFLMLFVLLVIYNAVVLVMEFQHIDDDFCTNSTTPT